MATISYSQYSLWATCPWAYKLKYVDGHYIGKSNIYSLFGTAMHATIQEFLRRLYTISLEHAQEFDYRGFLRDQMAQEFVKRRDDEGEMPATKEEMLEFWQDGIMIMDWLRSNKNRLRHYSTTGWELVDIELLIEHEIRSGVMYKGYLDIVFKMGDKYKIIDFKTSTKGWGNWAKKDKLKAQQLMLYKRFYSEKFGVLPENISGEFHILKRKLYEDCEFIQDRIQKFAPAQGTVSMNKARRDLDEFVAVAFDEVGERKPDIVYPKIPGDRKKNCQYCDFNNIALGLCDKKPTKM